MTAPLTHHASPDLFERARLHLRARRHTLTELARAAYPDTDPLLPVIAAPGWIPDHPLPVSAVALTLTDDPGGTEAAVTAAEPYWPQDHQGPYIGTYAGAVGRYDPPAVWYDAPVYRLLRAGSATDDCLSLEFSVARYFDAQNTGEALGYEMALRDLNRSPDVLAGQLRTHLANPFALTRRCASTGVDTLTLISGSSGTRFLMHRRSATGTAGAQNAYHVLPAGEFQPRTDTAATAKADLDLVGCVVREYVEELLGAEDAGKTDRLDPAHSESYSAVEEAIRSGTAQLKVLGLGLDPLTWKPEILTACVWPEDVFTRIFSDLVSDNEEGTLIAGSDATHRGLPFTDEQVSDYINRPGIFAGAGACLVLARRWQHELRLTST